MKSSEKFLILHTDEYFSRAWCMYEIAVFLKYNKVENIIFVRVPTMELLRTIKTTWNGLFFIFFCTGITLLSVGAPLGTTAAGSMIDFVSLQGELLLIALIPLTIFQMVCVLYDSTGSFNLIRSELEQWSLMRCKTGLPHHHKIVCGLIEAEYGSVASFDALVRTDLCRHLLSGLRSSILRQVRDTFALMLLMVLFYYIIPVASQPGCDKELENSYKCWDNGDYDA